MVRPARFNDATEIASIYNYYIQNDIATFEEEIVGVSEMKRRMEQLLPKMPWLVYETGGEILGYAYASYWNPRSAYKHSAESTVYLKNGSDGKGIGSLLYSELLALLRARNFRTVIGGISLPNVASERLHEKFGYEKVAHFKEVGFKFGRWIDVGYWQLQM